jgi:putative inorganic carbon (HCO3(-)) transporter
MLFALYLLFVCSWFLHLPARIPALGALRFDLLLVLALLAGSFSLSTREPSSDAPVSRSLWLLVGCSLLSVPFVEWPGSALMAGFPNFFKAFVFFYFTNAFVDTPKQLKVLIAVVIGCELFRVLEPLYLHVTEGYWGSFASMAGWEYMDRLSGAPHDVINPNGLAFVVLTVLPFLHYLSGGQKWGRIGYLALLPALIYTLLLTGSRSGLVGLAAIAVLVWWKSRHKVMLAAAVVTAVFVVTPLLTADQRDRYLSIWSSDTKNAGTAEGRLTGVQIDMQVALRRPLFGHGLGTSREANANFGGRDKPSHNLYTEVAQEIGFVGLMLFLYFMRSLAVSLHAVATRIRKTHGAELFASRLASALQVWLGMNVLFSFAAYGLSEPDWYLAAGFTVALSRLSEVQAVADAPAAPSTQAGVTAPPRPAGWPLLPPRSAATCL